ncbi:MAG: hypothetical protein ABFQ65_02940 [Nanoarchaeota archaeon]
MKKNHALTDLQFNNIPKNDSVALLSFGKNSKAPNLQFNLPNIISEMKPGKQNNSIVRLRDGRVFSVRLNSQGKIKSMKRIK